MRRPLPAIILVAQAIAVLLGTPSLAEAQSTIYRVPVTGVVELGLAPYIERSIEEAEVAGVDAVVLDMDTPGG